MRKLALLCLLVLLITSCSSQLTNEEASNAIKELYPKYCNSNKITTHAYFYPRSNSDKDIEALKVFRNLEKQGLVKINLKTSGFTANPNKDYSITPTQNSINKYDKGFPITKITFFEVIDISLTEKEAIVRYKVKNTQTSYYRLHHLRNKYKGSNSKFVCKETQWEEEITLIKFDNGWRVKK